MFVESGLHRHIIHRKSVHHEGTFMSLGPSISIFGDKHSLVYWLVFCGFIWGLQAFGMYRKRKGLAGKYYDAKLIGFFLLLTVGLFGVWKYIVYPTIH
jgi:hypothetical protein